MNEKELEFAIFCIESLAEAQGIAPKAIYQALTVNSDILYHYIVPCYETLHTQSKEYITDELTRIMKERGVL